MLAACVFGWKAQQGGNFHSKQFVKKKKKALLSGCNYILE